MQRSKDIFMEVRIQAEMEEEVYQQIPNELKERMTIKKIDMPNYKEIYKESEKWVKANDEFIDKLKNKLSIEEEIRANNKSIN